MTISGLQKQTWATATLLVFLFFFFTYRWDPGVENPPLLPSLIRKALKARHFADPQTPLFFPRSRNHLAVSQKKNC